jgi:hypothetical protein
MSEQGLTYISMGRPAAEQWAEAASIARRA